MENVFRSDHCAFHRLSLFRRHAAFNHCRVDVTTLPSPHANQVAGPVRSPHKPSGIESYYAEIHLPLGAKITGYNRIELSKGLPRPDGSKPAFYRTAEFWFESAAGLQTALATPEGQATAADPANFATGGVTLFVSEVARLRHVRLAAAIGIDWPTPSLRTRLRLFPSAGPLWSRQLVSCTEKRVPGVPRLATICEARDTSRDRWCQPFWHVPPTHEQP